MHQRCNPVPLGEPIPETDPRMADPEFRNRHAAFLDWYKRHEAYQYVKNAGGSTK